MALISTTQTNLTAGEISPRALGRFDLAKYSNAAKIIENFIIYQLGGALFRPGTRYVASTKYPAKESRIIKFEFSTTQTYAIEIGDLYMRFFSNDAIVLDDSGAVLEVVTPYAEADIFGLQFTQSADTMYITHNDYPPMKLVRTSANSFTLNEVQFIRGPFRDTNINKQTITPSSATGTTTLTATAPAWVTATGYIYGDYVTQTAKTYKCLLAHVSGTFATDLANGKWELSDFEFFKLGHAGSLWRVKSGVVKITQVANFTTATGEVQAEPDGVAGNLAGTAAVTDWAEGAFSEVQGFPATSTFNEQRLWYAGTTESPQTKWGSVIRQYDNFDAGAADDADAVTFEIATEQVNAITWLSSGPKSMQVGTSGGTFSASGGSTTAGGGVPITPTNVRVTRDTNIGSSNISPRRISSYVYYVQRNNFQLRELSFNYVYDTQISNDMNVLADHVLRDGGGVVDMDHQQSPNDRLWCVRSDGQIAVMTRNSEQEVLGWSRIVAGETSGGVGQFESIAILPKEGADDQVWVIVRRVVNGSVVRFVEYFMAEDFDDPWDPVRVDSSLSYDDPKTITGATVANPVVITSVAHGFSNGDKIKIDNVEGMTDLNTNIYTVANQTPDTFELSGIDGTGYDAYVAGGEARELKTVFSGLDHLEGEMVTVQVDGGVPSDEQTYLVTGGVITLQNASATVHAGLPYSGTIQLLKYSDGSPVTGQTKVRRVYLSKIRVLRSLGFKIGKDEDHLNYVRLQTPNDPLGHAPELKTGDIHKFIDAAWDKETEIMIKVEQPVPVFILACIFESEVEN